MKIVLTGALVALALLAAYRGLAPDLAGSRPNIILVLTDDQGYGDLSAHGNPVLRTPNLDRLHDESVRFTDFHVSPTCAPSRAALLTGRHEFKSGVTHTLYERERLAPNATTIADVLKTAGYTTAIFGKWHMGDEPAYWPNRRGFDKMFIHGGGGIGQTFPGSSGDTPGNSYFDPIVLDDGRFVKTTGYCTDVFFAAASKWIARNIDSKPFFAFISLNAPHWPLHVRPADEARYTDRVKDPDIAKFYGMIANIDDNVGRLLSALKRWGIERNTLLIFMNDNGGTVGTNVYNAGMRGGKATPWLGGTRAASFWNWPGRLKPAAVAALTAHLDFFPTLAEIAGAQLDEGMRAQVEGRSLVPLLKSPAAPWPDRTLVTHVGRWPQGTPPREWKYRGCSVRSTRWHLVSPDGGIVPRWQLFNSITDYAETNDVAAQHDNVVRELAEHYDAWWTSALHGLVNETAAGPNMNPFQELYRKQLSTLQGRTLLRIPAGEQVP